MWGLCVGLWLGMHYFMSFPVWQSSCGGGELVALLVLSFGCLITVNVLWLFLAVLLVGLQFVTVVFPDHSPLLFVSPSKHG